MMIGALLFAFLATLGAPGGTLAAPKDHCVAAGGETRVEQGTATCTASGTGAVAHVKGEGSSATATGDHNKARVNGDDSVALATEGTNNTATVTGDNSEAQ